MYAGYVIGFCAGSICSTSVCCSLSDLMTTAYTCTSILSEIPTTPLVWHHGPLNYVASNPGAKKGVRVEFKAIN